MQQKILYLLSLIVIGCQSPDVSDKSNSSVNTDSTDLSKNSDSVESSENKIFFDTTLSYSEITQEIDDYSKTVVNNIPPKPCEEYVLIASMGFSRSELIDDSSLYKNTLCEDILKFEALQKEYEKKSAEGVATYGCWNFTFRPVGEKYFIIEGVEVISSISEVTYYYQRQE